MKKPLNLTILAIFMAVMSLSSASAQVTNIKGALDVALKHKTIAEAGDKMKLYYIYATEGGSHDRWSFQFYDGGDQLHTVSVDKKGKANYSSRDKGSMKIFTDIDFSKLPAPSSVIVADIVAQAKAVLDALELNPIADKKRYLNYNVRNHYKNKATPLHVWTVTLPIGDGKQGKAVAFKDGKFDTINNSSITVK